MTGGGDDACPAAPAGRQSSARPTMTADAVVLAVILMSTPSTEFRRCPDVRALRSADREVDFADQRLARDLVGALDLEAIRPLGERRQRHGLPRLQLVPRREVELRRQRLRVQALRVSA